MQKETKEVRTIQIKFERERIHSSIAGAIRRKRIPMSMRGGDLIRGAVFGIIDHPEYSVEKAIARAVEMCKLPGSPDSVDEGYEEILECIDIVLREVDFYDIPEGFDIDSQDYRSCRRRDEKEIVEYVILGLVYDVRKDYCYSKVVRFLDEKRCKVTKIETEILKNMLFKKLIADNSTEECIYEYAYRKTFMQEGKWQQIKEEVDSQLKSIIPQGMTPYEYVLRTVDEFYEKN